jgi:hypothetical protein
VNDDNVIHIYCCTKDFYWLSILLTVSFSSLLILK